MRKTSELSLRMKELERQNEIDKKLSALTGMTHQACHDFVCTEVFDN